MKQNKRLQNNLGELLENITFFTNWREGNKMKQTSLSLKKKTTKKYRVQKDLSTNSKTYLSVGQFF